MLAAELARVAPRLATLEARERDAVEAMAKGIVAKLLHDPLVKLRDSSGPGDPLARSVMEIFRLAPEE